MSIMDQMRKTTESKPNGMEGMLLGLLKGFGVDKDAITKVISEAETTMLFFRDKLAEIQQQNNTMKALLEEVIDEQASLAAQLTELKSHGNGNRNSDGNGDGSRPV
jgi:hypothetical protein